MQLGTGSLIARGLDALGIKNQNGDLFSTGGAISVGAVLEAPSIDGSGQWGLGVSFGGTLEPPSSEINPIAEIPGLGIGAEVAGSNGSINDLRGKGAVTSVDIPVGRRLSTAAVAAVASIAPDGVVRDVVDGPVRKGPESFLGLSVHAAAIQNEGSTEVEAGVTKGFDLEFSQVQTVICSLRTSCGGE